MEKNRKWIFIAYAALILLIPVYIIGSSESILSNGKEYKFRMQGRDPFDFWRGDYLNITIDCNDIPTSKNDWKQGDKVYLKIDVDDEGYAYFSEALDKAPTKGDYIISKVGNVFNTGVFSVLFGRRSDRNGTVDVERPNNIVKYFINEEYAEKGEEALVDARGQSVAVVRVKNGNCRLQDVLIDGTPIMKYLE